RLTGRIARRRIPPGMGAPPAALQGHATSRPPRLKIVRPRGILRRFRPSHPHSSRPARFPDEERPPMAADPSRPFIYVMKDLRKVVPPKREILKGIWLSFYYGAKIGVLGANGAGKSSLLKIMAGVDQEFLGEAWLGKGHTVGDLEQGAQLEPKQTLRENVQDGVGEQGRIRKRWNDINARLAVPDSCELI